MLFMVIMNGVVESLHVNEGNINGECMYAK